MRRGRARPRDFVSSDLSTGFWAFGIDISREGWQFKGCRPAPYRYTESFYRYSTGTVPVLHNTVSARNVLVLGPLF